MRNDVAPSVRYSASTALGNIGPAAESALQILKNVVIETQDDTLRRRAFEAILKINKHSRAARSIFERALVGHSDPVRNLENRIYASKQIQGIGEETDWAIPYLIDALTLTARDMASGRLSSLHQPAFDELLATLLQIGPTDRRVYNLLKAIRDDAFTGSRTRRYRELEDIRIRLDSEIKLIEQNN